MLLRMLTLVLWLVQLAWWSFQYMINVRAGAGALISILFFQSCLALLQGFCKAGTSLSLSVLIHTEIQSTDSSGRTFTWIRSLSFKPLHLSLWIFIVNILFETKENTQQCCFFKKIIIITISVNN